MGGTEQQDPKVFARITNYLYISVVLDPPLLIMKCMNWSMASGCLASVCANSWSIMYLSASPGCSAPSACRQHGWYLTNEPNGRWSIASRRLAWSHATCKGRSLVDLWRSRQIGGPLGLSHDSNYLSAQQWPMIDKVCCLVCVRKPRGIIWSNIWA